MFFIKRITAYISDVSLTLVTYLSSRIKQMKKNESIFICIDTLKWVFLNNNKNTLNNSTCSIKGTICLFD